MKAFFLLLVLLIGLSVWFYLLLGRDASRTAPSDNADATQTVPQDGTETPTQQDASAPSDPDLPPDTDVGMEFPTLE